MTKSNQCLASMARLNLLAPYRPIVPTTVSRVLAPAAIAHQRRTAVTNKTPKPKKKLSKFYPTESLARLPRFSLCDAMRCLRAFEVGQDPFAVKYDLSVKLKTLRNAPPVKNRLVLPHPVTSDRRVGVICKEGSTLAGQALSAGAAAVGEESLFEKIREGTIEFTAMICHQGSAEALRRANDLGRILGPKGIMPNVKNGTITTDVIEVLKEMTMAEQYREKMGVVRFAVGQLWYSPDMLGDNIRSAVRRIKEDCTAQIGQVAVQKQVFEIVLSTTHGPGFSLNGSFAPTEEGITPLILSGNM